jgi:hypothetical protein
VSIGTVESRWPGGEGRSARLGRDETNSDVSEDHNERAN